MAQVVTLEDFRPAPRYDSLPWTQARIEESALATGPWVSIETIALSPVDADPTNPAYRDFTTELGTDLPDLWYQIVFVDATGDESLPTLPVQNTEPGSSDVYATINELARILKIRAPTVEQQNAMERVLVTASGEIRSEIDLATGGSLSGWQLSLVAEVALERAVEHWRQQESPFGLIGLGPEMGGAFTSRDSWERHAHKLAPLKARWGIA